MPLNSLFATALIFAASQPLSDAEEWNRGVDFYNAGDVTNALSVLRPLMVSPDFGARAAEVVAKLESDAGNFEEALSASQIALRANPKGEIENRNFSCAVANIETCRDNRHITEVLEAAQGKDPVAMLRKATAECRDLLSEAGNYRTNSAERAIEKSIGLSKRTKALADVWIPIREVVVENATNDQEIAYIISRLDAARAATADAAIQLEDLNGEAYVSLAKSEGEFTGFMKQFLRFCIRPQDAIEEDLVAQSNALMQVEAVNGRPWQAEACEFTDAFRATFPEWARTYEQQAQNDTNREPFTAETQEKISALAAELDKLQNELVDKPDQVRQQEALDKIAEIIALMPKDKGTGSGESASANAAADEPEKGNEEQEAGNESADAAQQPQKEDDQEQAQDDSQDEKEESIEALLKKAEERNEEYEAEKKARIRKAALPPNERDW